MATLFTNELDWNLPSATPLKDKFVIIQVLSGEMFTSKTDTSFGGWGDQVVRWAYLNINPDEIEVCRSNIKGYEKENKRLEKELKDANEKIMYWHTKYLNILGAYHNKYQCDAFIGEGELKELKDAFGELYPGEFDSRGGDSNDEPDDNTPADVPRLTREVSLNDIRDIFLECLRKEKEEYTDDGK